jgi:spore coat polysaccharide biosynthesis protein SpsF
VIEVATLRRAHPDMTEPGDREHVTQFFYRRPQGFRIHNFSADRDASGLSLSIDTPQDAVELDAAIAGMDRPHWQYTWVEALELRDAARAGGVRRG